MNIRILTLFLSLLFLASLHAQVDPSSAPVTPVDRFSASAGTLMVRDADNGLPAANAPIDFDQGPFITRGLGPNGQIVEYYNFDVQPLAPAPIYVLMRESESDPVESQLNIIDVKPGEMGYNDFWQIFFVTVPDDYVANTITSFQGILDQGYAMEASDRIVNCPVVPEGSIATKRLEDAEAGTIQGWYKDSVVHYFLFTEKSLTAQGGVVPLSPIFVTFNINPGLEGGGPPSGFVTEENSLQTHNVLATLPDDDTYSPLWLVNIYDNANFDAVEDLTSATAANILAEGAATVNCPVVLEAVEPSTAPVTPIDRFSASAGTLMVRDADNGLPAANALIDFDQGPFITRGLGPNGQIVEYYNFDVQPVAPAPIYVLMRESESDPVESQLNIIDVKPGEMGYNDFWQIFFVTVPDDYVANTITSFQGILDQGYAMEALDRIVNCPVVPEGSTASKRLEDAEASTIQGWYKDSVIHYFLFTEKSLTAQGGVVPLSPIFVTFNINPGLEGGGPPSGFVTEENSLQTHNVLATLPDDDTYSPLWLVNIYDNANFDDVEDLTSASAANVLAEGAATVNCPVVATDAIVAVKERLQLAALEVFPNPASSEINLFIQSINPLTGNVNIRNSLGQLILTEGVQIKSSYEKAFNISSLRPGLYFITIETGQEIITRKFFKTI